MNNYRTHWILLLLLTLYFLPIDTFAGSGKTLTGIVQQVKDGDTVVIVPVEGGEFFICRLYGIDTPETTKRGKSGQPYGEEASKELKRLVLGQTVEVTTTGAKTYNREVCIIRKGSLDINPEMVRRGYAWAYVEYLKRPHASEYVESERIAREKKLGLWKDRNPVPPWEFRKMQRQQKDLLSD